MAAHTTDRLWSSTHVLGARNGQVPPVSATETRETDRCRCCPYGYHIDVDFLDYLNAVKPGSGLTKLKKIHGHRLRQRQAMENQLLMVRTPPSQRPSADASSTDASESSGSSSPVTPRSQSEEEPDSALSAQRMMMAELDASIANALDSIESLLQPPASRTTEVDTAFSWVSTGDVHQSAAAVTDQNARDPPSASSSSVSASSLRGKHDACISMPEVFQSTSAQPFRVENRHGNGDSGSAVVELQRSETADVRSSVATTAASVELSTFPRSSDSAFFTAGTSDTRRHLNTNGIKGSDGEDSVRIRTSTATTASEVDHSASDTVRRLPHRPHSASEVLQKPDAAANEGQTVQHSTASDSTVRASSTSTDIVSTTVTTSADVDGSGRQLPVRPTSKEPETSLSSSNKSSFSSIRALLNRKSGSSPRSSTAKIDRPVRRSRQQANGAIQTTTANEEVTSAPAPSTPSETVPDNSKIVSKQHLQADQNGYGGVPAALTTSATPEADSKESITSSGRRIPPEVTEVEAVDRQTSASRDQVDHDAMQVSFDELTKAMEILSPAVERRLDDGDRKLDRPGAPSVVNPDVLMTIRRNIASSLQQMRLMEQQMKLVPALQLRVSVLKEEKRLLKLQLRGAKNGSREKTVPDIKADANVGVTLPERPVAGNKTQQPERPEVISLRDGVELRDVGIGDSRVDAEFGRAILHCASCKSVLRQHSSSSPDSLERTEASARTQKFDRENSTHSSVSVLVGKLQDQDKKKSTVRPRSVENTVHESETSTATNDPEVSTASPRSLETESTASVAVRRPRPPVPHKEISIRREEGKNHSTVGIQCTLLGDTTEGRHKVVRDRSTSESDAVNKRTVLERVEVRAREPDLVTTHCVAGSAHHEPQLRSSDVFPAKSFADKQTETGSISQHPAAPSADSTTFEETFPAFRFQSVVAQLTDCSVNTDISGDICGVGQNSVVSNSVRGSRVSDSMAIESTLKLETVQSPLITVSQDKLRSVKDASCSADIVTKPIAVDDSSCTDESPLYSEAVDVSEVKHEMQAKPSVKDVECSADIRPLLVTVACNTMISETRSLRGSPDAKDASCQADVETKISSRDVASGEDHTVELSGQPDIEREPSIGNDVTGLIAVSVRDVGSNTEVALKTDAKCGTVEDKMPTKDVSCSADLKLSVSDKSCGTVPAVVCASEHSDGETSKDVGCLTDSLKTCDMSSNTEQRVTESMTTQRVEAVCVPLLAGARLPCVEAACMTDVVWRPPTEEIGCSTDAVEPVVPKPPSVSTASSTDLWLMTSDVAFLDILKQALRSSMTERASMTDLTNVGVHTSDGWTNTESETPPSLVDGECLAQPDVCDVGCSTEAEDKLRKVRDAASGTDVDLYLRINDASVSTDTEAAKEGRSVAVNTDTTIEPSAIASLSSGVTDVRRSVRDAAVWATVIPSTRHARVGTEVTPTRAFVDAAAQACSEPTTSTTSYSRPDAVPRRDREVTAKVDTSEVACSVALKPPLRSVACGSDAEAVSQDLAHLRVDNDVSTAVFQKGVPIESKQTRDVAILHEVREIGCNTENAVTMFDGPTRFSTDFVAPTDSSTADMVPWTDDEGVKICRFCRMKNVQKPSVRDVASIADVDAELGSRRENNFSAESKQSEEFSSRKAGCVGEKPLAGERVGIGKVDLPDVAAVKNNSFEWREEVDVERKPEVRNTGCDAGRSTTADKAINTDFAVDFLDVKRSADQITDTSEGVRKPHEIPRKLATENDRTGALIAKPVTKDAFCITDISVTPSDDDSALRKSGDREHSHVIASTCNTDAVVKTSASDSVEKARQRVREIGCGTELSSRPSTREAGCTAKPLTKTRSCVTDPIRSQPAAETPVKAETTRTGLRMTRKAKRQTEVGSRSSDNRSPPRAPSSEDAAFAAGKSPTFDVACGTDFEFHSKYFNVDDGGLLRQLSADDVAELLRVSRDPSASLSSPTCDVACNTEYDSRPCTPARVISRYYAIAATEPPLPTAVDVACGSDWPSTTLCDVGCGTDKEFQTCFDALRGGSDSILHGPPTAAVSTDRRRTELSSEPADKTTVPRHVMFYSVC